MRHVLQGVVGAGLLYPVMWYFVSQGVERANALPVVQSHAAPAVVRRGPAQNGREPMLASRTAPSRETERRSERTGLPEVPSSTASIEHLAAEPIRNPVSPTFVEPHAAEPTEPIVPAPLPPALPKLLSRVADVQAVASNPTELADRVQKFQANPEELAQLKAFAEQFVQLPPSSADFDLSGMQASKGKPGTSSSHR